MKVWHISDIAIYMMSGDGIEFSEFWLGDFLNKPTLILVTIVSVTC